MGRRTKGKESQSFKRRDENVGERRNKMISRGNTRAEASKKKVK